MVSKSYAKENARLRRELFALRKAGMNRQSALYNGMHIQGADVASSATVILKDPACRITGTVTITAIATAPAGAIRRVLFTGILTLTHNGTSLILPTAANITTAANDSAEFQSLGSGNWKCNRYTLADGTILGVVPISHGGTSNTTAVTAIDALHTAGSNIASASTVNLDTATGQVVTITGSVTINAFTLTTAGVVRRCRLSGSPNITHNATSLKCPGSKTIYGAPNDTFDVVSLGSGNVEIRNLQKAGAIPMTGQLLKCDFRMSLLNTAAVADVAGATVVYFVNVNAGVGVPIYEYENVDGVGGFGNFLGYYQRQIPETSSVPSLKLTNAIANCTKTNGNAVVNTPADGNLELIVGMEVTGTGIQANTVISSLNSNGTGITLSKTATDGATVTLTFKIPASKNVDVFAIWDNVAQTVRFRFGTLWSSGTTRGYTLLDVSSGTLYIPSAWHADQVVRLVCPNQVAAMNDPTYIGTIRTTSTSGQTQDNSSSRFVFNMYNRRPRPLSVTDSTATWNYTTATWRQANGNTANQFDFVVGYLGDDNGREFEVIGSASNGTANKSALVGIGIDSTSSNVAQVFGHRVGTGVATPVMARLKDVGGYQIGSLSVGYHFVAWLEISETGGTTTWIGTLSGSTPAMQMGMTGTVWG